MQKYIKEVFKDYNGKNEILDAEIENVNLYKKTNKLQVKVVSKNRITLDDIEDFEKYLVERFKVNGAILDISYDKNEYLRVKKQIGGLKIRTASQMAYDYRRLYDKLLE